MIEQVDFADTMKTWGVTINSQFVPASLFKDDEWRSNCINHNVTIRRGASGINTNYSQGIGHLPKIKAYEGISLDAHNARQRAIETGGLGKKLPTPTLIEVMYSLLMDSNSELTSFADWCSDYGYEDDSIKALKIFEACRTVKLEMLSMFTSKEIEEMNDLLQDY